MPNLNKVMLMGNLTRDIDIKHLESGQSVANIGLAINKKFKTKDGDAREEVVFVDCEAWGKTAEVMAQYLAKGKPVFIEGRLKLDTWEQDGQNRSKLRVVVESFQFIDSQGGGESNSGQGSPNARTTVKDAGNYGEPISADDIPF